MGRASKLNERQWGEIGRRLANHESARSLAKEFGVSPSTISERFSERLPNIRKLATTLATVEKEVEQLPESERVSVRNLADQMKVISKHLGNAAASGAKTAEIILGKAVEQAGELAKDTGLTDKGVENLKKIAVLSATANEAGKIAIDLVKATARNLPAEEDQEEGLAEAIRKARLRVGGDE